LLTVKRLGLLLKRVVLEVRKKDLGKFGAKILKGTLRDRSSNGGGKGGFWEGPTGGSLGVSHVKANVNDPP